MNTNEHILLDIENTANTLRNYLEEAERNAKRTLEAMSAGKYINTMGFGALGHQLPFDLAVTTERLAGLVKMAQIAGLTEEEIQTAYENGAIGMSARFERDRAAAKEA
ncbi:hypothetical protein SEA_EULA_51 [Microbacterium phage Eula]|uniref:hypothetical protein n=1 Tax=Microbacterium phage Eula TaxID=2926098 RepID=UPI0022028CDD|nr:hypothetical protein QDW40_gp51 [Microbacterium phage Eula]UVF61106.1 hypothetical protein SEA_EULA_51 [Microbacterium phage Eula]